MNAGPATNVLVVVPAYNEQDAIADVVAQITASGFRVLVVDDGSTDHTRTRAAAAGAEVVSLNSNSGVGVAIRTAFAAAVERGYEAIVQCDADGQHPVEDIPALIAASKGVDVVVGSRFRSTANTMTMGVGATFGIPPVGVERIARLWHANHRPDLGFSSHPPAAAG